MKFINRLIIVLILLVVSVFSFSGITFSKAPLVNCIWLPWCSDVDISKPVETNISKSISLKKITIFIWEWIKYVAVLAVVSLMLSWFMYIISWGEEEKVKKSKTAIIWSLVWVFLSISAWTIINLINTIKI